MRLSQKIDLDIYLNLYQQLSLYIHICITLLCTYYTYMCSYIFHQESSRRAINAIKRETLKWVVLNCWRSTWKTMNTAGGRVRNPRIRRCSLTVRTWFCTLALWRSPLTTNANDPHRTITIRWQEPSNKDTLLRLYLGFREMSTVEG